MVAVHRVKDYQRIDHVEGMAGIEFPDHLGACAKQTVGGIIYLSCLGAAVGVNPMHGYQRKKSKFKFLAGYPKHSFFTLSHAAVAGACEFWIIMRTEQGPKENI